MRSSPLQSVSRMWSLWNRYSGMEKRLRSFPAKNKEEQYQNVKQAIDRFLSDGNAALGIITKTNHMAEELYGILKTERSVNLISPESSRFQNGVSVTSIQMAKGLEFDEVVVWDADNRTYCTDFDRCLLYIACTRAMHKLTLIHTGEQTGLIRD